MKNTLIAIGVMLAASTQCSEAKTLEWKTEADFVEVQELPSCDPNVDRGCGDHVPYRLTSKYGVNYYLTFFEGVRAGVGFGTADNQAWHGDASALHAGAFDWGGIERNGSFKPVYVIKRFYVRDLVDEFVPDDRTVLVIFRLLDNGKSCVVDTNGQETTMNAVARAWARQDFKNPKCAP